MAFSPGALLPRVALGLPRLYQPRVALRPRARRQRAPVATRGSGRVASRRQDAHAHTWPNSADLPFSFSMQMSKEALSKLCVHAAEAGTPRCSGCKSSKSDAIVHHKESAVKIQDEFKEILQEVEVSLALH